MRRFSFGWSEYVGEGRKARRISLPPKPLNTQSNAPNNDESGEEPITGFRAKSFSLPCSRVCKEQGHGIVKRDAMQVPRDDRPTPSLSLALSFRAHQHRAFAHFPPQRIGGCRSRSDRGRWGPRLKVRQEQPLTQSRLIVCVCILDLCRMVYRFYHFLNLQCSLFRMCLQNVTVSKPRASPEVTASWRLIHVNRINSGQHSPLTRHTTCVE